MGRETLLAILLLLIGGLAMQPLAWLRGPGLRDDASRLADRRAWLRFWLPLVPACIVAAWLRGWALRESDPVHDRVGADILAVACLPFAVVASRAALKAMLALARKRSENPICTVGFLRPRITFSPFLARSPGEAEIRAAWEHERAHARYRDPLRIWLARLATNLQWPRPSARERFERWLEALECAQDEEARARGASGVDLATAILATVRHAATALPGDAWSSGVSSGASLAGEPRILQRRIARLLAPLPVQHDVPAQAKAGFPALMVGILVATFTLGAMYREALLHPLLVWTWTV